MAYPPLPPVPTAAPLPLRELGALHAQEGTELAPPPPLAAPGQPPAQVPSPPISQPFLDQLLGSQNEEDWTKLPLARKHIDEQVVEILLEQFEDDLNTLIDFVDVGDRTMFQLVPPEAGQLARWHDPQIHEEMIMDALQKGGPKGMAKLLDDMNALEKRVWARALRGPIDNTAGPAFTGVTNG